MRQLYMTYTAGGTAHARLIDSRDMRKFDTQTAHDELHRDDEVLFDDGEIEESYVQHDEACRVAASRGRNNRPWGTRNRGQKPRKRLRRSKVNAIRRQIAQEARESEMAFLRWHEECERGRADRHRDEFAERGHDELTYEEHVVETYVVHPDVEWDPEWLDRFPEAFDDVYVVDDYEYIMDRLPVYIRIAP